MSIKKGKIITLFSGKGGSGKTITTINIAGIYSKLNKKTLIIDFDIFSGGIATILNVNVKKTLYNLVDDISNSRYQDINDYITKYDTYIDVISCPIDPRQGNKIDALYVETILSMVLSKYEVILIDTSHTLNDINLSILDKTDLILLVITNDPIDLKNTKSLVAILNDTEKNNYKILLNSSINTGKDYFSLFDIKNVIKANIDYTISTSFYIKNIDKYLIEGKIPVIELKTKTDAKKIEKMAINLLEGNKKEDTNG